MSDSKHVLVVDDEPTICWAFEKMLSQEGHTVSTASSAEDGIQLAEKNTPDLIVLDVRLPGEDGLTALPKFLQASNNAPVVVITAFGDLETAVTAVQGGAVDYLTKPFRLEDALQTCRQALRLSAPSPGGEATSEPSSADTTRLVGSSPAMQQVFRQIALVADSDLSVLITGETGTGKELVAAALHRHGRRFDRPYVPIAPVALNADLIESELFGHVKGAFTGAPSDRAGLFEQAAGGTVLLDEMGDLPLNIQVKLLRVLEQGEYCRVGDTHVRRADVRIIAATNSDLEQAVRDNRFREDLFHRLSGVQIHLPPLRNRLEDLRPLCHHFLRQLNYSSADSAIDDQLLDQLRSRPWYGNVRELRHAVQHAAVVARGRALTITDFPPAKPSREETVAQIDSNSSTEPRLENIIHRWTTEQLRSQQHSDEPLFTSFLSHTEPAVLRAVLQHTTGNRARAAEILGIHRGTLRDRLKSYGIDEFND